MNARIVPALVLGIGLTAFAYAQDAEGVRTLIARLKDKDISERQKALRKLQELGPKNVEAVPALIDAFDNPNPETRQLLVNVLGNIGKPAVPELGKALKAEKPVVRRQACLALAKIGPDAKGALPALAVSLETDTDPEIRGFAVAALVRIDPESKDVLPRLVRARFGRRKP